MGRSKLDWRCSGVGQISARTSLALQNGGEGSIFFSFSDTLTSEQWFPIKKRAIIVEMSFSEGKARGVVKISAVKVVQP